MAKKYKIQDKEGKIYEVNNLSRFCEEKNLTRRLINYTNPKFKGTGKRYQEYHKGFKILNCFKDKENKIGKDEVKSKVVQIDGGFVVISKKHKVTITTDELRLIKKLYTIERKTINQVAREMLLLRGEVVAILSAFSITHDDIPFIDEDIDELTPNEMAEKVRIEKKRAYFKKLEENKIKDMEKELKKLSAKDYFFNKFIEGVNLTKLNPPEFKSVSKLGFYEMIIPIADLHYGSKIETRKNKFNSEIAKQRINKILSNSINKIQNNNISKVYVVGLGDLMEAGIRTSMRLEDELNVVESTVGVANLISNFLNSLSKYAEIEYHTVSGNHTRIRARKDESIKEENFQRIIDYIIEVSLSDNERVKKVENSIDEIIEITCQGKRFIGLHGDEAGFKKLKEVENLVGYKPDFILSGHLHHNHILEEGEVTTIQVGSIVGLNCFAKSKLLFSNPSTNIIMVNKDEVSYNILNLKEEI